MRGMILLLTHRVTCWLFRLFSVFRHQRQPMLLPSKSQPTAVIHPAQVKLMTRRAPLQRLRTPCFQSEHFSFREPHAKSLDAKRKRTLKKVYTVRSKIHRFESTRPPHRGNPRKASLRPIDLCLLYSRTWLHLRILRCGAPARWTSTHPGTASRLT
jgi:hypothetical protein